MVTGPEQRGTNDGQCVACGRVLRNRPDRHYCDARCHYRAKRDGLAMNGGPGSQQRQPEMALRRAVARSLGRW